MKSFADRLTPGQIQQIFDALGLPWRDYYSPENGGWVNLAEIGPHFPDHYFNSDLSINIHHGGFVDQYAAGHPDPMIDGIPVRGDIVTLTAWLHWEDATATQKAIEWIKQVLGMGEGVKPPELQGGYEFANDWLDNVDGYTRVPDSLLHSSLSTSAKLVWIEIFSRINKGQLYSYAGTRDIAKKISISKPTVLKAIAELKKAQLLIEKTRGYNNPPSRFPLVAEKTTIDDTIMEQPSNRQTTAGKETLPPPVKKLNGAGKKTLPESDPLNKTQKNKNQIATRANRDLPAAVPFWTFLSDEQEEAFRQVLAELKLDQAPAPPPGYQRLFQQTFMKAPHGFNPYTGEVFDERGYPRDWDEVEVDENSPEFTEATRHAINDSEPKTAVT